ncbi:MAG: hypothetical protein IJ797_02775 [Selenomonadaceae bacterium]|nr:hypothetical protein [Selenomonadaceae bacterium]
MTTAQMEVVELIKIIPEERMDNFIQMVKNFVADNNCKMELSESEIRDRKKMEADRRERMALLRRVDWMTALQQEAISIIQSMPYDRLVLAVQKLREYANDEIYEDKESAEVAKWQADPDKYENEINEWVNGVVKESRREKRAKY